MRWLRTARTRNDATLFWAHSFADSLAKVCSCSVFAYHPRTRLRLQRTEEQQEKHELLQGSFPVASRGTTFAQSTRLNRPFFADSRGDRDDSNEDESGSCITRPREFSCECRIHQDQPPDKPHCIGGPEGRLLDRRVRAEHDPGLVLRRPGGFRSQSSGFDRTVSAGFQFGREPPPTSVQDPVHEHICRRSIRDQDRCHEPEPEHGVLGFERLGRPGSRQVESGRGNRRASAWPRRRWDGGSGSIRSSRSLQSCTLVSVVGPGWGRHSRPGRAGKVRLGCQSIRSKPFDRVKHAGRTRTSTSKDNSGMDLDRTRMAKLIAENGPMEGSSIRGALDWEFGRLRESVKGHDDRWFIMTASGWDLTERGRAAANGTEVVSASRDRPSSTR